MSWFVEYNNDGAYDLCILVDETLYKIYSFLHFPLYVYICSRDRKIEYNTMPYKNIRLFAKDDYLYKCTQNQYRQVKTTSTR